MGSAGLSITGCGGMGLVWCTFRVQKGEEESVKGSYISTQPPHPEAIEYIASSVFFNDTCGWVGLLQSLH